MGDAKLAASNLITAARRYLDRPDRPEWVMDGLRLLHRRLELFTTDDEIDQLLVDLCADEVEAAICPPRSSRLHDPYRGWTEDDARAVWCNLPVSELNTNFPVDAIGKYIRHEISALDLLRKSSKKWSKINAPQT